MAAFNYGPNLQELRPQDEIKFVVADRQDFEWALAVIEAAKLWQRCSVLLSPVFGVLAPLQLAAWLLATGLPLRLNLQWHKYIWGPETRGV